MKLKFEKIIKKVNNNSTNTIYKVYQNDREVTLASILSDLEIDNKWNKIPDSYNPCKCQGGLSLQEIFQNAEFLKMTVANYFHEVVTEIRKQSYCEIITSECIID